MSVPVSVAAKPGIICEWRFYSNIVIRNHEVKKPNKGSRKSLIRRQELAEKEKKVIERLKKAGMLIGEIKSRV